MTHNLCFLFGVGTHTHSGKEWNYSSEIVENRVEHFARLFTAENADIIFLQELASEEVLQQMIQKSGIDYSYFIANPDSNGVGNAVLLKSLKGTLTSIPSRRDFAYVQTTYHDKPLHLLGIHLKSNFAMPEKTADGEIIPMDTQMRFADGLVRSELFRADQAKKAREVIDAIFTEDPEAQVVVAGDFNTRQSTPIFRMIQGGLKELPDHLIATSKLIPESERFSMIIGDDKHLPDHILVSKSLQSHIKTVRVLNAEISLEQKELPVTERVVSDHAPVVVEID